MHNAAVPVYADMSLIPEMPVIALPGLAGIGIEALQHMSHLLGLNICS